MYVTSCNFYIYIFNNSLIINFPIIIPMVESRYNANEILKKFLTMHRAHS